MKFKFHRPDFVRNSEALSRIFPKPEKPATPTGGSTENAGATSSADVPSVASLDARNARARALRNFVPLKGNPVSYRQMRHTILPTMGAFAKLPPELFLHIARHLDGEAMKNLVQAGMVPLKQQTIRDATGRDQVSVFPSEFVASSLLPSIAQLMQEPVNPERQRANDDAIARIESQVKQINAAKARGKLGRKEAHSQIAFALFDHGMRRSDLAKQVATRPLLTTTVCELMQALPDIPNGDQSSLLNLFAQAIKNDFTQFPHKADLIPDHPEKGVLSRIAESTPDALSLYGVLKLDERVERAERLKEGIAGLLHAYPKLSSLRKQGQDPALEVLAMCHEFADAGLKEKIAAELEKLPLKTLRKRQSGLSPCATEFARGKILRDFDRLSPEKKSEFLDSFAADCSLAGRTDQSRLLRHEDYAPLFRSIRQLGIVHPRLHDEIWTYKASGVVARCVVRHHENMDRETRAELMDVALGEVVAALQQLFREAMPHARKQLLLSYAPVWNDAFARLESQKDALSEPELEQIMNGLRSVRAFMLDLPEDERAEVLNAFTDGIRSLQ